MPVEETGEDEILTDTPSATVLTATPGPTNTMTAIPVPTNTLTPTPVPPTYYVSPDGSDDSGGGSVDYPWGSIAAAVSRVPDGALILVQPGIYHGQVALERRFETGIVVRSAEPYQARLEYDETVVTCYRCASITLEGFEIAHDGEGAGRYVIQIQDVEGDGRGGRNVVLHNNIIHDSRNNDLVKVNNGATHILITGNIFYNMGGPGRDSHLDINSVSNVIVEDNIFFNDFRASNRDNDNDTGSFVVIKDSNGDDDAFLGAQNITVRRNIFLNWQGDESNTFIVVGEDSVEYFQAKNVLIENNLMLGNSPYKIQAAFQLRGARDVLFRHNTVAGDLPGRTYAMRLARADGNPRNENIFFYNNIWSDPTGTMGEGPDDGKPSFAEANPEDTRSFILQNNLYWNGARSVPNDEEELVNITDDPAALIADPLLPTQDTILLPIWQAENLRFADGSATVRAAFERLVFAYGIPGVGSPVIGAADPDQAPADDILGRARPVGGAPDIGAVEQPSA